MLRYSNLTLYLVIKEILFEYSLILTNTSEINEILQKKGINLLTVLYLSYSLPMSIKLVIKVMTRYSTVI